MTFDVDGYYGVTVTHGEKKGPRRWQARAYVFRRDTQEIIDNNFFGEGATMTSADKRALQAARRAISMKGIPDGWKGPKDGFRF